MSEQEYWYAHMFPPRGYRMRIVPIHWKGWAAFVGLLGLALWTLISGGLWLNDPEVARSDALTALFFGLASIGLLIWVIAVKTDHATSLYVKKEDTENA